MLRFESKKLRNDCILIIGILVCVILAFVFFKVFQKDGQFVSVIIDGQEENRFSLSDDIEHNIISGENGEYYNRLIIKENKVYIIDANCRDGICVDHKPVNKSGETIVCLPHKLVVSIENDG